MRIITREELSNDHLRLLRVIKQSVFIYPTDTIYGIGCNAENSRLVGKIRKIKNRPDQPFSIVAPSKKWIHVNCHVNEEIVKWLENLPGPYTLILKIKKKNCIAKSVNNGLPTIGIRIPDNWFTNYISSMGVPIITTSVNKSGEEFMTSIEDIDLDIKNNVDLIIYDGQKKSRPSTLVDMANEKIQIEER